MCFFIALFADWKRFDNCFETFNFKGTFESGERWGWRIWNLENYVSRPVYNGYTILKLNKTFAVIQLKLCCNKLTKFVKFDTTFTTSLLLLIFNKSCAASLQNFIQGLFHN